MSHYNVAVFSREKEDVSRLLAPYNVDNEDPRFLKFIPITRARMKEALKEYGPPRWNETLESFMRIQYGYVYDCVSGRFGYFYNPNAKYDYYDLEGDHVNILKRHDGKVVSQAKVNSVDFSVDEAAYNDAIRFWKIRIGGESPSEDDDPEKYSGVICVSDYIEKFGTAENYAKYMTGFPVCAFVTPDGQWVESRRTDGFGVDDFTMESKEKYRQKFQKAIQKYRRCWITIADCHF